MRAVAMAANYFSLRGRLSKSAYLRLTLRLTYIAAALMVAGIWLSIQGLQLVGFAALAGLAAVFAANVSLLVRRLHDRNLPGWIILIVLALSSIAQALEGGARNFRTGWIIFIVAAALFNIWWNIETLFRRGKPKPNRYGPDPLASAIAAPQGKNPSNTI